MEEERRNKYLKLVKDNIGNYPDFPKPGILFRDIFSVLKNPEAFHALHELLLDHVTGLKPKPDVIVALESRGFLFGPSIALQLNIPFVPIRKKGKLPGKLHSITFSLEYGSDTFEIQDSSIEKGQNIVIVDDLLATGGSLNAACSLIQSSGGIILECLVLIELLDLKGRAGINEQHIVITAILTDQWGISDSKASTFLKMRKIKKEKILTGENNLINAELRKT